MHVLGLRTMQADLLQLSNVLFETAGCRALSRCPQPDCKREIDAAALRSLLTLAEWQAALDVVSCGFWLPALGTLPDQGAHPSHGLH